jgi:hypothetical protein
VRELSAVLDFNSPYCVFLVPRHAVNLGFVETAFRPRDWQKSHPGSVPYLLDLRGIERSILIRVPEVSLGKLVAKSIDAVVLELGVPRMLPFDLILGRSFLQDFRLTVDAKAGFLSLD